MSGSRDVAEEKHAEQYRPRCSSHNESDISRKSRNYKRSALEAGAIFAREGAMTIVKSAAPPSHVTMKPI